MNLGEVERATGAMSNIRPNKATDWYKKISREVNEGNDVPKESTRGAGPDTKIETATSHRPSGEANTKATSYRKGVQEFSQTGKGFRIDVSG